MAYSAPSPQTTGYNVTATDWTQLVNDILESAVAKVTTAGDMVYATGANALARLAIGSANKVLTSSGTAPQWSTALTGLTGITVASGGITVTGNSTITGTLGGLTGLTVASGAVSLPTGALTLTMMAVPRVSVYNTTGQAVSAASGALLTYTSEAIDTDTCHSNAVNTSRLTCTTAGTYLVHYIVTGGDNGGGDGNVHMGVVPRKNGTDVTGQPYAYIDGGVTDAASVANAFLVDLSAADYVELWAEAATGGANLLFKSSFGMMRVA